MNITSGENVERNGGARQAKLAQEIHSSILGHAANNGGHVHVASMMGIEYIVWWNSLNRNQNPIFEDAARLALYMRATGNLEPLRLIADYCGQFIEPKPAFDDDGHDLRHEALVLNKEAGDFGADYDEMAKDGLDGKEKKYLRRKIQGIRDHAEEIEAKIEGAGK
jgi:hypothetical protein